MLACRNENTGEGVGAKMAKALDGKNYQLVITALQPWWASSSKTDSQVTPCHLQAHLLSSTWVQ